MGSGQELQNLGVGARSVNGYTTTLSFSCLGLTNEALCEFDPPNLALRSNDFSNSRWTLSVNPGTPEGSYHGKVRVTDGVLTQDFAFTLNVGDFSMSLTPTTIQMFPTDQTNATLILSSINQFDQTVNLTCNGIPSGTVCTIPPFNTPTTSGAQTNLNLQTESAPVGNYQLDVTGTSAPLTHSASAELQIWDFTGSVTPTSATVKSGTSASFNVSVTPINGFNGVVTFACFSSTGQIACAFNPTSTSVPPNGTATSVLTLTPSSQLGSVKTGRNQGLLRTVAVCLILPVGIILTTWTRMRRAAILPVVAFGVLLGGLSCGGSNGGGTGGVGGRQSYSVTVQVASGNNVKPAGTITLIVN
jgi:hypothetical protein